MSSPDALQRIPLVADFTASADALVRQAFVSQLTNLLNREAFESVARDYDRTLELGAAVAFVDLTGFKDVNDREGYDTGNLCITDAGRRFGRVTREVGGVAFHFSGDEFVAVLEPGSTDRFSQLFLQDLASFAIALGDSQRTVPVRATCGLALPVRDVMLQDLRSRAEQACKAAKRVNQAVLLWDEDTAARKSLDLRWRCVHCSAEVRLIIEDDGQQLPALACPRCATVRAQS